MITVCSLVLGLQTTYDVGTPVADQLLTNVGNTVRIGQIMAMIYTVAMLGEEVYNSVLGVGLTISYYSATPSLLPCLLACLHG